MTNPRSGIQGARTSGHGVATLLLAAALATAWSASEARARPAGPDRSVAEASTPGGRSPGMRAFPPDAAVDTLDHSWREVFPVAIAGLEQDDWVIQRADTAGRRITTRWKPVDHLLARLAFGDVQARCVVDLVPISGGRTELTFRGGLASASDLEASPAYPAARRAYARAARRYVARVRAELARTAAGLHVTR